MAPIGWAFPSLCDASMSDPTSSPHGPATLRWLRLAAALAAFAPFGLYGAHLADGHGAAAGLARLATVEGALLAALLVLPFAVLRGLGIDWARPHDRPD